MNELQKEVSDERSLDEYISRIEKYNGNSFAEYFNMLLNRHNVDKSYVVKNSQIERTFVYKLLNGTKRVTRNNLLALCLTAGCSLAEIEKCLVLTGNNALYSKNIRDSIIIYAINRGLSVQETNELLDERGENLIREEK